MLAATRVGPLKKILLLSAVSAELENATPGSASVVIARIMADSSNASIEFTAFDANAGDDVRPPGLLHGSVPIIPAAAGAGAMANDLAALIGAIAGANIDTTDVTFVCGAREAALIKFYAGPKFDYEILTTSGLAPKSIMAVAPSALFVAYDGSPVIETAKETAYHFGDPAADIVDGAGVLATPVKSLYQSDILAIRLRAQCAWNIAPGGAAVIDSVTW